MTEENRKKYEQLKATGTFTEDELARLRAGFEKAPRKFDYAKSELHMRTVVLCQQIEYATGAFIVDYEAEGTADNNAYIILDNAFRDKDGVATLSGKIKQRFDKAIKNADEIRISRFGMVLIFKDVIKEGE